MGKSHRTNILALRLAGIIYLSCMIAFNVIPSIVLSTKLSTISMTYFLIATAFGTYPLLDFILYLIIWLIFLISFIMILKHRYAFYVVPLILLIMDFVFFLFIMEIQIEDLISIFACSIFKLIGCVIFIINIINRDKKCVKDKLPNEITDDQT